MKKTSLILSICALVVAAAALVLTLIPSSKTSEKVEEGQAVEAPAASIAYFQLDLVVAGYDMANELQASFEKKAKSISDDLTRRQTKLENEDKDLADKLNKGLVTRSTAEVQYTKLQEKVQDFQNLAAQKQNELAEEQAVMLNNIANAIGEYVKEYNKTAGYSMIFASQSGLLGQPVVDGDSALDLTNDIINGLNEQYKATKTAKKK